MVTQPHVQKVMIYYCLTNQYFIYSKVHILCMLDSIRAELESNEGAEPEGEAFRFLLHLCSNPHLCSQIWEDKRRQIHNTRI